MTKNVNEITGKTIGDGMVAIADTFSVISDNATPSNQTSIAAYFSDVVTDILKEIKIKEVK